MAGRDVGAETVEVADVADARLQRAREARARLADDGVHLLGVRHHSPGCARAVGRVIERVRPAVVLVEGPDDLDPLLAGLTHPDTVPPVALLTMRGEGAGAVSALYPLAAFSPEWVAFRTAAATGVPVHLIDLPWSGRADEEPAVIEAPAGVGGDGGDPDAGGDPGHADDDVALLRRTLQSERYFAHSSTLAALATRLGCRDHDELWEHLFEIRGSAAGSTAGPTPDADDALLEDVFVWAALSRLDYETEVLTAEGSLAREHRMLEHVERWRAQVDGPIVVVTGAFHTLALVEALADLPEGAVVRAAGGRGRRRPAPAPGSSTADGAAGHEPGWIIRYTLDQLDGLRGYGAGMPSPGYHQRVWDAPDPGHVAREVLQDLVADANGTGQLDRISTASLQQAVLQAERLAQLRQRPWPGRTDVLDAVVSCLTQGEVTPALRESLAGVLGGTRLGVLPADLPQPPLVASARRRAEQLRFVVTDAQPRTTSLDVHRTASARARSRHLALHQLLGTAFARMLAGPRYASGADVHLLRETWEYAWTPRVETRLVALIEHGTTLEEVATAILRRRAEALTQADAPPSPRELAALVVDAAQAGLATLVPPLLAQVRGALEATSDLRALADAGAVLLRAWNARVHLDLGDAADDVLGLVDDALLGAGHRLALLGGCGPDQEGEAIAAVVALRGLVLERGQADGSRGAVEAVAPTLQRLRRDPATAPGVRGALLALAVTDGETDDADLVDAVGAAFSTGADPVVGVRLLDGVLTVAPELVVRDRGVLTALDTRIGTLEHEEFLALLPDLRRSFSRLRPLDTDRLARHVAEATGARASDLVTRAEVTEGDLAAGLAVDAQVRASLVADGLLAWAGGER